MSSKDVVLSWLNDAHAMESALVQILEHQVKDAKDFPTVQSRLEQHLGETRRHAQMVQECVQNLGGSTSSVKSGFASLFGQMQALSTGAAQDEMVKNGLADYAAENFEVASYEALIAAATEIGDTQTASVCRQIMQEDQAMADWLQQNLPTVVTQTLASMSGAGANA